MRPMASADLSNMRKMAIETAKEARAKINAVHLTVFWLGLGNRAITIKPMTGKKMTQLNKFRFKAIYLENKNTQTAMATTPMAMLKTYSCVCPVCNLRIAPPVPAVTCAAPLTVPSTMLESNIAIHLNMPL